MLILVLLIAVGAVVVGAGSLLFGAGRHFDDVERFHRDRGITTGWARDGVVRPVIGEQKSADGAGQERASTDA